MTFLKYIIAPLAAIAVTSAACAAEPSDTVMSIGPAQSVVITETASGITVTATESGDGSSSVSTYTRSFPSGTTIRTRQHVQMNTLSIGAWDKFDIVSNGLGFGFVNAIGAPRGMDFEMGKSFEFSWLNLLAGRVKFRPWNTCLSLGFGLDWRNYRTTSDSRFIPADDGTLQWGAYPEGCQPHSSRVKVFSLCVPLTYTQPLPVHYPWGGRAILTLGTIACFNTHASVKSIWTNPDFNRVEQTTSHIPHRRFSVDFFAALSINSFLSVYTRYSPMDVLKTGCGPSFKSFSTGLMIGF